MKTADNQVFKLEKTFVNVEDFRNGIDHLFRKVRGDYHSCVGLHEYRSFHETLKRVFDSVSLLDCKRAKPYDREQFEKVIQAAINCFHKSSERIAELENVQTGIKARVA